MDPNTLCDATDPPGRFRPKDGESGFAMVVVLTTLIPAVLLVGMFASILTSRTDELQRTMALERALMAAESGVDYAIFRGRQGLLAHTAVYNATLGVDTSYRVEATHLLVDGEDNDDDFVPDDPDEDVFQVVVIGRYRNVTRRLAAYLGPVPLFPPVSTALGVANASVTFELSGSSLLNGVDGGGGSDVPALSAFTPGTVADLLATLSAGEQNRIQGPGGPPSLGTMAPIDLAAIVSAVQNVADLVLTSASYSGLSFGSMASNDPRITYRAGNVKMQGISSGGGVLVVTGDLEVKGDFSFDGLIVVLGNLMNSSGSARIRGAILQGPAATLVDLRGNFDLQFSSTALDFASAVTGLYVAFNGWQELSRQ